MRIIIANWKMNPLIIKDAKALFEAEARGMKKFKYIETVICPPACFLSLFSGAKNIKLGAQDLFWELQGAYTGQVSGKMLKNIGCEYVIVGHSERRRFAGEDDEIVSLKLKAALKCGLKPILCVGEQSGEEMGQIVEKQLKDCLKDISKTQLGEIIICYEPVWAISPGVVGSGKPCLPDDAFGANLFIKKVLTAIYSRFLAEKAVIIYGGSVDSKNAAGFIKEAKMQGALVGGASLVADEFVKIGEAVNGL